MNKYFATVFFGFTALVAGWLLIQEREPNRPVTVPTAVPETGGAPPTLEPTLDGGILAAGGGPVVDPSEGGAAPSDGAGGRLPDLGDAPKKVKIGVILITYAGAEDAKDDARARGAALSLAKELAAAAAEDFAAAVKKGDPGSTGDAGTIARGILDADVEARVFTLDKGAVSEPIDTPKGYWIVKRLE